MKWIKRIAVALGIIALLAVLADIGLNAWIKHRLPGLINEKNHSPYSISYQNIDVSLLDRRVTATGITIIPKNVAPDKDTRKKGIYGKVQTITVNDVHLWALAFGERIVARDIVIEKPDITLLKKNGRILQHAKSINSEVVAPFNKIVYVSDVFLNNGSVRIMEIGRKRPLLDVRHLSVKLQGILITDETLKRKMPFTYKTYAVACDSVFYQSGRFYHMLADKIRTTGQGLTVSGYSLVPEFSRSKFDMLLAKETDIYTVSVPRISVSGMDWGFKGDDLFFRARSVALKEFDADIYRNKSLPDDPKKKKLYSEMLRNIPFWLDVDSLLLRDGRLMYEEHVDSKPAPGKLTFSDFNLCATNVKSGFHQTKMPDVKIKVNCDFMKTGKLDVDWDFNVLNTAEAFNIKGRILNFPAGSMTPFTKPYLNMTFKGDLDQVYFNFYGNDDGAKGDFAINYDDLKVRIYRKEDRKKRNKILSAIANLFVKDDTKDKVTTAEVDVKRAKDRSFFNLLWKSLEEGLKKILL